MAKPLLLGILVVVAAAVPAAESSREANLTLVNDCNYPVWPMVIPNDGSSPISGNTVRLDRRGGAAAFIIPLSRAWSGQVVARAGCAVETPCPSRCASGEELAAGAVVQLQVHAYWRADVAVYGVSLSGGFNVPATVYPARDLNPRCPAGRRVTAAGGGGVVACRSDPAPGGYFKQRCPKTLTWSGDAVDVDQRCVAPGELKVIFCPKTMVTTNAAGGEPELLRAAVAVA
uniref:Thaumatin-like protein n=1 Tax=Setaria italica TaxID=4555 RepID=K3Z9C4_SETIT